MKLLILAFSFFGISFFGGVNIHKEPPPLYFTPPNTLQYFSLGYQDFLANILWLRLIQDVDFCSFKQGIPSYKGDKKYCELGWSYRMADTITELAPRFKSAYHLAFVTLSIFVGDQQGAERILEKALQQFPKDWKINFYAAYMYGVELNQPQRAEKYQLLAVQNGGPHWLYDPTVGRGKEANRHKLGEAFFKNLLKKARTTQEKQVIQQNLDQFRRKYPRK